MEQYDLDKIRAEIFEEIARVVPKTEEMLPTDVTYEDIMEALNISFDQARRAMKVKVKDNIFSSHRTKRNGKSIVFFRRIKGTG